MMKETIYTIPVSKAFTDACPCPFCRLHSQAEQYFTEQTLGASMMEPDFRMLTNRLGFCAGHYAMLLSSPNKLSLALVLETHLEEVRNQLDLCQSSLTASETPQKSGFFKPKPSGAAASGVLSGVLKSVTQSCAVCAKTHATMERYLDVFFYLWSSDSDFQGKFNASQGFCLPHYHMLADKAFTYLKKHQTASFLQALYKKEQALLAALQNDIHRFTLKFDYRNADMPWENAQDAPRRVIEALSGPIYD